MPAESRPNAGKAIPTPIAGTGSLALPALPARVSPSGPPPPRLGRAGNYELLLELAMGGMATVYLGRLADAHDTSPLVAVKRPHKHLAAEKVYLSMLLDEARLASAIEHPNVVKVRELGFEAAEPFVVMDYVDGASLSDLRKELAAKNRALEPRIAVRIVLDALAGLQAAHVLHDEDGRHLGIIHRDVSPHNIIVGSDGASRITDFGIAKAADRVQVTRTHEVKGKLAYLAPERVDKRRVCTVQSDVFSMAAVLWEAVAGRRLFRGEEAIDTLQEVMNAEIPSLRRIGSSISPALDEAIMRGLARELDDRYKTAAEFGAALDAAAGRTGLASAIEVAQIVEAVFGSRLRRRQEHLRHLLGDAALLRAFDATGLVVRKLAPGDPSVDTLMLDSLAPPAPSARYAFGNITEEKSWPKKKKRDAAIAVASVVGFGLVLGTCVAIRRGHDENDATTLAGSASAASASTIAVAPPAPATSTATTPSEIAKPTGSLRLSLPFLTDEVRIDDHVATLDPASDEYQVPGTHEGARFHVTARALDGSFASAWLQVSQGQLVAEGEGFVLEDMEILPADPPAAKPRDSSLESKGRPRKKGPRKR